MDTHSANSTTVASVEHVSSIIRLGGKYGQPYHNSLMVRWLSPTAIELMGLVKPLKPSDWAAVIELADDLGIEQITFRRMRSGSYERKVLQVKRYVHRRNR